MSLPRSQIASKMASLRQKLEDIREYKRILAEDGVKPDAEDKMLESELIQRLLGLEKDLARMDAVRGRRRPDEAKKKGPKKKTSKGLLEGVKKDLSKVKAKTPDAEPRWGGRSGPDERRGGRGRHTAKPAGERPGRTPKPASKGSEDNRQERKKPSSQKPGGQKPGGQKPGGQKPGGQKPGGKKPGGQKPGGKKPGGKKPGGKPKRNTPR